MELAKSKVPPLSSFPNILNDLPSSNIVPLGGVCLNSEIIELTQGSPSGGTWSGNGIVNGYFSPSLADIGVHELTYTFTSPLTGCSSSSSETMIVYANPSVNINELPEICENNGTLQLTGGVPPGGTWSGPGVSGNIFIRWKYSLFYIFNIALYTFFYNFA